MRVLFFGDIVGRSGRTALTTHLPALQERFRPDLILANAENAAGGTGLTPEVAEELLDLGLDALTLGNHAFAKREIIEYLNENHRVLRPLNFPANPPGVGSCVLQARNGSLLGLISLHGRVFFLTHPDDPFSAGLAEARRMRSTGVNCVLVDFHAEATSEKAALAWHLDGEVSAVVGTHTHVQTADERILPGGTAYITDVGMTGPVDSVIGVSVDLALERFLTQMPVRFSSAAGPGQVAGVALTLDDLTGRAVAIERILLV
jgi:hypothetical protein